MSRGSSATSQLRIIGGSWRGRKISFRDAPGLRPTPDRIRETLFNWLMPVIGGSRCLDLFAGSGALGFEAASRAAAEVTMVEAGHGVAEQLRSQVALLAAADRIQVVETDALHFLAGTAHPFDVVFLDPPFGKGLLQPVLQRLGEAGWLHEHSLIYIEAERTLAAEEISAWLPSGFQLVRSKQAGDVGYHLARRE